MLQIHIFSLVTSKEKNRSPNTRRGIYRQKFGLNIAPSAAGRTRGEESS